MSALTYLKKFRYTGNKTGGFQGWKKLESDGLGIIIEKKSTRGTEKVKFVNALREHCVWHSCVWVCSVCCACYVYRCCVYALYVLCVYT